MQYAFKALRLPAYAPYEFIVDIDNALQFVCWVMLQIAVFKDWLYL